MIASRTPSGVIRRQRLRRELFRQLDDRVRLVDQRLQVPLRRIVARRVHVDDGRQFRAHVVEDVRLQVGAFEDLAAFLVDDVALGVHHVVVLDDVLADVEVVALDLRLRRLDGARHHAALERHVVFHAELLHHARQPLRREPPHDVVLERHVEARRAGVALPAGTAAELVVDAARLVPLGADDVQAAGLDDLLVLVLPTPLASRSSGLPPSTMSVPRPAMFVAMVTPL